MFDGSGCSDAEVVKPCVALKMVSCKENEVSVAAHG